MKLETSDPPLDLSEHDVQCLVEELAAYRSEFDGLFARREQAKWAGAYLSGLLQPNIRKSAELIALNVPAAVVRDVQRFVGEGAWDDRAVLDKHAELVAESLGCEEGVLIVDGSDFPKQGKHSVGVGRQYCGALGKIANCQAAVFLAYASGRGHTLLDARLYLPQDWLSEQWQALREECHVPEGTAFQTKPELAWEMIAAVHRGGQMPFAWVACDEGFGNNPAFLGHLEAAGINYFAEVPVSTLVQPLEGSSGAGTPSRVDQLVGRLPHTAWRTRHIKEGEKGPQSARFAFVRAVAVRDKQPGPEVWVVFRRDVSEPAELKIFLSNAPADTARSELVRVSGMRWPIETCFRQAKGSLGMDQYQARTWRGWHHHMTMVILAHHFLVRLKLKYKKRHRHSHSSKLAYSSPRRSAARP